MLNLSTNTPPDTTIHPTFFTEFCNFTVLHNYKKLSFKIFFQYWTQNDKIIFIDPKYDHDFFIFYIALQYVSVGRWEEMGFLLKFGSFFHQLRQNDTNVEEILDKFNKNQTNDIVFSIFEECSNLELNKEQIEIFLSKYLPKIWHDFYEINKHKKGTKMSVLDDEKVKSNKIKPIMTIRHKDLFDAIELGKNENNIGNLIKNFSRKYGIKLNSVRPVLNGNKQLLMSEIRHKLPDDLNLKAGDVIDLVVAEEISTKNHSRKKTNFSISSVTKNPKYEKKRILNKRKKKRREKKKICFPSDVKAFEKDNNNSSVISSSYHIDHSRKLSKVFEEVGPKFKSIRTNLNNLKLKKTQQKKDGLRRQFTNQQAVLKKSEFLPTDMNHHDSRLLICGGKAGKVSYVVRVGEITSLYKSRKLSDLNRTTSRQNYDAVSDEIDLHRLSKEEARMRLDEELSLWVRRAMEGCYPWVLTVRIICGGGNQILSDVVRDWIKENDCVANAF